MASHEPFFFAGLWDTWHAGKDDAVRSFTILTTEPNELTAKIHNRMPGVVPREDCARWLDPKVKDHERHAAEEMIAYTVSSLVNNVKYDGPELIEPLES
jgi:putative SOS response-associated peptidase YedK